MAASLLLPALLISASQVVAQPDPPPDPGDPRAYSLYKPAPAIKPPTPDVHLKHYNHLYKFPAPPTHQPVAAQPQYSQLQLSPRSQAGSGSQPSTGSFRNPIFRQYEAVSSPLGGSQRTIRQGPYDSVHAPIQGFSRMTRWKNALKKNLKKAPKPKRPRRR